MYVSLLIVALSTAATVLFFYLFSQVSLWWAFLVWPVLTFLVALLYAGCFVFYSLLCPTTVSPAHRRFQNRFIFFTVNWLTFLFGVRHRLTGIERLPADQPFLLVANHRSAFDPFAFMSGYWKEDIRFVGKEEIFKVPTVGPILSHLLFLSIDRSSPRNAVTSIRRASEIISKERLSIGIFPEGTRSKDGNLQEFHAGSFKAATMAGCPVAVASVRMKPRKWIALPAFIDIRILGYIDAETVKANNTNGLSEIAEKMIREDLGQ